MEIKNKFKLGDTVYYPGADLGNPHIIKAEVTGIVVEKDGVSYNTLYSFRIPESNITNNKVPAKVKLMKLLKDRQAEIIGNMAEAIETIDKTKAEELVNRGDQMLKGDAPESD